MMQGVISQPRHTCRPLSIITKRDRPHQAFPANPIGFLNRRRSIISARLRPNNLQPTCGSGGTSEGFRSGKPQNRWGWHIRPGASGSWANALRRFPVPDLPHFRVQPVCFESKTLPGLPHEKRAIGPLKPTTGCSHSVNYWVLTVMSIWS